MSPNAIELDTFEKDGQSGIINMVLLKPPDGFRPGRGRLSFPPTTWIVECRLLCFKPSAKCNIYVPIFKYYP